MNDIATHDGAVSVHGARLSRRGFLATGGALIVAVGLGPGQAQAADATSLDPTRPASWIEIHADDTILIRTGKCDFGQSSIYTAYRQIVAEELGVPFEAITTVVSGDTDITPDGGGTFGLLRDNVMNLRKVAAYTREAVLELAAERFGVARDRLSISEGTISGGGRSASYGALVEGQSLDLEIPVSGDVMGFTGLIVEGDPPLKPASEYTIVGKSFKNSSLRPKMSGETTWVGDVRLPDMVHARVVHPASLGSTLIEAGEVDTAQFPGASVVVIGNLVGVVSPSEWEAEQAARQVAATTRWTEWKGLPGHEKLFDHLVEAERQSTSPVHQGSANKGDVAGAQPARTHSATYWMPYLKHAPIGPTVSLADVRKDGRVTIHTHSQNPQYLRFLIAKMLETPESDVVVKTYPGPGHYGRSNGGNAGSEDEAVLLSRKLGRPVRVQWTREDDIRWSTQSSPALARIAIGLDQEGRMISYQVRHSGPPMQDDRPVGALLTGLPTIDPPAPTLPVYDKWIYGAVANVAETAQGIDQIGQKDSPISVGLRSHSLRTPIQFQENFPRETAISEAAALAGADPLQFRIDHVGDERFETILKRLRDEAGWETRPSPAPWAATTGSEPLKGRGVSIMFRGNGHWACACEIAVTPDTGAVRVTKLTAVVDPGIVVNPLQLKRQVEGATLMGVSHALHEELAFDESGITASDWFSYPILTMAEMPEVKVVLAPRPEFGVYGQGSEAPNALASPAIAAAFFDATGKPARRIPLRPDYVKELLAS